MNVRAPATSANIGAGFDAAAVAFELWNELEVTEGEGVVVEGEGAAELAADHSNLAVRAYALLADPAGKRFHFVNRIPLERGLGSSAAAIALGLVAAAPQASAEELLAAGLDARAARRQPRGRAARRPHARLGREAREDRREPAARRDRRHSLGSERRPGPPAGRCPRPSLTRRRRRARAARPCSGPAPRAATPRSSRPRSATGCTSPTVPPRSSTPSVQACRPGARGRRCRAPGRR